MGKTYEITGERVVIQSDIPFLYIMDMEICHRKNEHGKLVIKAAVQDEDADYISHTDWSSAKITVCFRDEEHIPFFCGSVEQVVCQKERNLMTVQIMGTDATVILDRQKKCQSFQNSGMTYKQVVKKIIGEYGNVGFIWELGADKQISSPIIQYQETDWEFLKRICSHFQGMLFANSKIGKTEFFMGLRQGKPRNMDHIVIAGQGFDSAYYENGCYENHLVRNQAFYLVVNTKEHWQTGDSLLFRGRQYYVFERKMSYKSGEFICTYRLGTRGMCYQKKIFNKNLAGLRLEGTIRRSEEESVYLQLDLDKEERSDYPWAWSPETNNLCYCMPEAGTKAVLYLPTQNEEDGQVILANVDNREKGNYRDPKERELVTNYNNKIGLYTDRIMVDAKNGKAIFTMDDLSGIQMCSNSDIMLNAAGQINIIAKDISITAPQDIVCKTTDSNIEICRDFNFYAPGGVKIIKTGDLAAGKKNKAADQAEQQNCWQLSYHAMGAIPAVDLAAVDSTGGLVGMAACGSVPKVAKGSVTVALSEVMEGKQEDEVTFPNAFRSMENLTVKGGYALPSE